MVLPLCGLTRDVIVRDVTYLPRMLYTLGGKPNQAELIIARPEKKENETIGFPYICKHDKLGMR